jgi:hypothetical protein
MGREAHPAAPRRAYHAGIQQTPMQRRAVDAAMAEGDDAGAARRPGVAEQLELGARGDALDQMAAAPQHGIRHARDAVLFQQRQAGIEAMRAEQVRAAALEAPRIVCRLPLGGVEIAALARHVPAVLVQRKPLAPLRPDPQQRQALWPQHPLVAVRHHEVRLHGLHVERQRAQTLDGIHAQGHAASAAGRAQAFEIHSQAVAVLD